MITKLVKKIGGQCFYNTKRSSLTRLPRPIPIHMPSTTLMLVMVKTFPL